MPLSDNTSSLHNRTSKMSDSDQMKFSEFCDQLFLAEKILYILISILIIMGNTLVLLATWRERSLHQPSKYFVACLAVADLLVGIFIGPVMVYGLSVDNELLRGMSIHFCRFIVWIDTLALTASICTLMFITFDRYFKISKPLQYRSRMTTSKSLKIIFIIWLISTAFATYSVTPDSGSVGFLTGFGYLCLEDYTAAKRDAFYTSLSVILFLVVIVMLIMYALILIVARERQKMLRNGELGETSTGQNQRSVLRHDLKIVRMLLIVVGVFFFCWLPVSVWNLLYMHYPNFMDYNHWPLSYRYRHSIFQSLIHLLALSNSLCNPIIYACLNQTYREAFKHLFEKILCHSRSNAPRPEVIELRPLRND